MAFLGPSLRRTKVLDRPVRRAAVAGLISLAVNAGMLLVLAAQGAFDAPAPMKEEQVELAQLTDSEWSANRRVLPVEPPPPAPPPPPPPPPPPEKLAGRILTEPLPDSPRQDAPDPGKARFLSDRDRSVEKETRAIRPSGGDAGEDQVTREAKRRQRPGEPGTPGESSPPRRPDDRLAMLDGPKLPSSRAAPRGEGGDEGLGSPSPPSDPLSRLEQRGDPRLLPSLSSMSKIAPNRDYIDPRTEGLEEGEENAVNTRSFVFLTYFKKMKEDVGSHWRSSDEGAKRDPTGALFGNVPVRVTVLRIVLDASGEVKSVDVAESSGLDFLDRQAVRAIRAAAPFYNVPKGLPDANGEVRFHAEFAVINNRPKLRRPSLD